MKRSMSFGPIRLVAALALAVVGITLIGVSRAVWGGTEAGRPTPSSLLPQSAEASSSGLQLRLSGAQFSGLDTYVRIEVSSIDRNIDLGTVRSMTIRREDATAGSLSPRSEGVSGAQAQGTIPVIMPFAPVNLGTEASIGVQAVTLAMRDGSTKRIAGNWILPASLPENIAALLRTETITADQPIVESSGISIRVLSAVRTTVDTRITFAFQGTLASGVLTPPALMSGRQSRPGAMLNASDDGTTATWSFPPTEFGKPVSVSFSAVLAVSDDGVVGGSTVDMHGVILDLGHQPQEGDSVSIGANRVLSSTGQAPAVARWVDGGGIAPMMLELEVPVAADPEVRTFPSLLLPSGTEVSASGRVVGFDRDSSGTVVGGRTVYRYPLDSPSAIDGTVVLGPGRQAKVINGNWTITVGP